MRWIWRAAMLGSAMLAGTMQADAASFDCRKAVKPVEQAICSDPPLSAADDRLAMVYARLMAALPAALKPSLQASQRSWLVYLPLACASDANGAVKDKAAFAQCLKTEYETRISTLDRQPQQVGPFKTLAIGEFQAMPSSSNDPDFFPIVTHVKSVPVVFDGDPARAAQLNAWLQALGASDTAGWDDPDTSASLEISLAAVNNLMASAQLAADLFGVGAAHPLASAAMRHLLLATGKLLTFHDIFVPQGRERLTELGWAALSKTLGNDLMVEKKSDLTKLVIDPGHWTFGPEGLTIRFNVYEVAAYVMGPQAITLSWRDLRDMLTPLGRMVANTAQ